MPAARPSNTRPGGSFAAVWTTLAIFLALLSVLAVRLASGHDPGLLAMKTRALRPRQVLVKRVYERVVVVHLPPDAAAQSPSSSQQVSSEGGAFPTGALVTRAS